MPQNQASQGVSTPHKLSGKIKCLSTHIPDILLKISFKYFFFHHIRPSLTMIYKHKKACHNKFFNSPFANKKSISVHLQHNNEE